MCKPSPNITPCYAPSGGCGTNSYWDSYSCSCNSSYPYYQQENFDRLAYESSERINCVKSALSQYEFDRLRYFIPTTNNEQNEIMNLGNKVKSCWGYATTKEGGQKPAGQTPKAPIEYEGCLFKSLGEKAYKDIYYGIRQPTYEEHLLYESCYGERKMTSLTYYTNDVQIPKETDACLRQTLKSYYSKVKSGQADVPYEAREEVNRCFGINPQAFEEGRVYKIPDEVRSCLTQSIGETAFSEINSGKRTPSNDEKVKGESCFAKLQSDQLKFLPRPSEEIPFLEEDTDTINLSGIKEETKEIKGKGLGGKLTFSGVGPANSVIYIYIYTEPIVVTTKTDENGDWVYELDQPLEGEKHIAYATVKTSSGKSVRSSVFDFTVVAADEGKQVFLEQEDVSQDVRSKFMRLAILTVGFALFAVVTIVVVNFLRLAKNKKIANSQNTTNGKSNDDTGSGSVN